MTLDSARLVRLRPPLPCVAHSSTPWGSAASEAPLRLPADAPRPGFVLGIGPDALQLSFSDAEPGAGQALTVRVLLPAVDGAHRQHELVDLEIAPAMPGAPADAVLARAVSVGGRARLADLLTLIRKDQHITLCDREDVEASDRYTGFADVELVPRALPELAWQDLDTAVTFLGRRFQLPLLITGMTGGIERGTEINRRLAQAAQEWGIPMGVGSQRVALENPAHAPIFAVKRFAPKVFLIGNLGVAQLSADGQGGQHGLVKQQAMLAMCRRAVDMIEADALALHVNVLQELIQVEGDRDFRGLIDQIGYLAQNLEVPLLVKEVGGGIDPATARALLAVGVRAIDCGGKGGTSWSHIEGMRALSPVTRSVATAFRDWGIPTAVAVAAIRRAVGGAAVSGAHDGARQRGDHSELPLELPLELVATGGIRDGWMVAKALALGANLCGIGLPLLRAALVDDEEPGRVLAALAQGLKTAMLCSGARSVGDLGRRLATTAEFARQMRRFIPDCERRTGSAETTLVARDLGRGADFSWEAMDHER